MLDPRNLLSSQKVHTFSYLSPFPHSPSPGQSSFYSFYVKSAFFFFFFKIPQSTYMGFPDGSVGKESACNAGDPNSIPGLGRSPREGKGYSLQYSGLENSMDCTVHGVAKSQTRLSNFHGTYVIQHRVLGFLCLAHFIQHNTSGLHCHKRQGSLLMA